MNSFELSTYILHQVFPFLNGRDPDELVNTPIQVWFDDRGGLTFAPAKGLVGPKWGEPTFTIRLSLRKIREAFTSSPSIKQEDQVLDALVVSVFNEIRVKVDAFPLSREQRKGLELAIEKERGDIDHLMDSLNMTIQQRSTDKQKELH